MGSLQWCSGVGTHRNVNILRRYRATNAVAAAFRQIFAPRSNFACSEWRNLHSSMMPRKWRKISSWTWIKKASYPWKRWQWQSYAITNFIKEPIYLLFVISVAYRLLSDEEGQSLWPCNTNSFLLKMSLYKRCIFYRARYASTVL